MNQYAIYSKPNCQSCNEAKMLLEMEQLPFKYLTLNVDYTLQDMFLQIPRNHKSFPAILKNGQYLGGLAELKNDLPISTNRSL